MPKLLRNRLLAIPAFVLATTGAAHAALPQEITTAISDYQTDALSALALVLAAGAAVWALRTLGRKLNWW